MGSSPQNNKHRSENKKQISSFSSLHSWTHVLETKKNRNVQLEDRSEMRRVNLVLEIKEKQKLWFSFKTKIEKVAETGMAGNRMSTYT